MKFTKRQARHGQLGQGSVEFIVIFALFAALLTGLLEMTRVFRTKHTLNTATFAAARAGALNYAQLAPMNAELANGMATTFSHGRSAAELALALGRARDFESVLRSVNGGVQIVSPTQHIFDQLHRTLFLPNPDPSNPNPLQVDGIPNDNLRFRPAQTAALDDGREINLQDANLLKIRTLWCHRLIVPALDRLIYDIVNAPPFATLQQTQVCNQISKDGPLAGAVPSGYYIAITADATLRMQSAIVDEDNLPP